MQLQFSVHPSQEKATLDVRLIPQMGEQRDPYAT